MQLSQIAEHYRVNIRRDECGDQVISGKRGHLYLDGDQLCVMWMDARPMNRSKLAELGGTLWMGDISDGVQDAWVKGISPEKIPQALRLVGAKRRRILSEARRDAQRGVLVRARAAKRLSLSLCPEPLESIGGLPDGQVVPNQGGFRVR
jgi:hypothetical protein